MAEYKKDLEKIESANETEPTSEGVELSDDEQTTETFVARRVTEMQNYRKDLGIEKRWKEADAEYEPGDLDENDKDKTGSRVRFESDQEDGLRSRMVRVNDNDEDEWRSRNSSPMLLTKIQTAISIIVDSDPEATFKPLVRNYKDTAVIANALWQRNWWVSGSKEVYKKFVFNLAKYGWASGRTFPKLIKYDKEILTEIGETPEKNVYETATNVWYNDIAKQNLDPFRTWIDEQTEPYDDYSMNDCYYELDFSYDQAKVEFGRYENFDTLISENENLRMTYEEESTDARDDEFKERQDIITIGFYENRLKDLYVIRIPKKKAILHYCPLPNDDGMLSLWHAPWILRTARNPYGVSLWETIRSNKQLYDKMNNMTMDQLVLSIMKMFFYTGTSSLLGDGQIKIKPGQGRQLVNGKVDWMNIPGPGAEAWEGLRQVKSDIDGDSGIVPTIEGEVTGKTLGEVLHSKESALKRLKTPVENIAYAIEQDAYIALSWMTQVYSTPEVKQFAQITDIQNYNMENGIDSNQIFGNVDEETGEPSGPFKATYLPQLGLKLDTNGDKLIESREERFFQVGKDLPVKKLYWRGMIKVIPKSILSSSAELDKQRNMQFFNIIVPLLANPPEIFAKPVMQLAKSLEMDPRDWLPDSWIQYMENNREQPLFMPNPAMNPMLAGGDPMMGKGVQSNQTSMQGGAGTTPGTEAPTVVPQNQMPEATIPGVNANLRNELSNAAGGGLQ